MKTLTLLLTLCAASALAAPLREPVTLDDLGGSYRMRLPGLRATVLFRLGPIVPRDDGCLERRGVLPATDTAALAIGCDGGPPALLLMGSQGDCFVGYLTSANRTRRRFAGGLVMYPGCGDVPDGSSPMTLRRVGRGLRVSPW